MDVEYVRNPIKHLVFRNIFTKKSNDNMVKEILSLEDKFECSSTGGNSKSNPSMRTNSVLFLDDVYINNRKKSFFLAEIDRLFGENQKFREILSSIEYPISEFIRTNVHETQVSRYGSDGQKYEWHVDRFSTPTRVLSFVYYFWKEPKEWTGGQLQFTDSPIYDGIAIEELIEGDNMKTISPENNMGVIFGGTTPHRVLPTHSPEEFDKGRFSANIWVGFK